MKGGAQGPFLSLRGITNPPSHLSIEWDFLIQMRKEGLPALHSCGKRTAPFCTLNLHPLPQDICHESGGVWPPGEDPILSCRLQPHAPE